MAKMGKYSIDGKPVSHGEYERQRYDSYRLLLDKGSLERIKGHALMQGESVRGFINRAIAEAMEREKETPWEKWNLLGKPE